MDEASARTNELIALVRDYLNVVVDGWREGDDVERLELAPRIAGRLAVLLAPFSAMPWGRTLVARAMSERDGYFPGLADLKPGRVARALDDAARVARPLPSVRNDASEVVLTRALTMILLDAPVLPASPPVTAEAGLDFRGDNLVQELLRAKGLKVTMRQAMGICGRAAPTIRGWGLKGVAAGPGTKAMAYPLGELLKAAWSLKPRAIDYDGLREYVQTLSSDERAALGPLAVELAPDTAHDANGALARERAERRQLFHRQPESEVVAAVERAESAERAAHQGSRRGR